MRGTFFPSFNYFILCSLAPQQATGNALTGFNNKLMINY